jgi:hypothetical protein
VEFVITGLDNIVNIDLGIEKIYRIYSRISREILDKILILNCQFDLYTGHNNLQYLYGNDPPPPPHPIVVGSREGRAWVPVLN